MFNDDDASSEVLLSMLKVDCILLFEHYGCAIGLLNDAGRDMRGAPISMIDAGSPELELSLVLRIPYEVLSLSYLCQDIINDISEEQLEDWARELANQLMGKLKNRLVSQQVNLKLGLPAAYFDIDDATLIGHDTTAQQLFFSIDGSPLELTLAYELLDPHWQPSPNWQAENQDTFGGEIELF